MNRDQVYASDFDLVEAFRFDERVAAVFSDMVRRSVPGYGTVLSLTGLLAGTYLQPDSRGYDLGCSLGASTLAIARAVADQNPENYQSDCQKDYQIIAVDNSEAMVTQCQKNIAEANFPIPIKIQCADIRKIEIKNAGFVVMNYILQFLPQADRLEILQTIANGMKPGGALMLSEKIVFDDPNQQQRMTDLHHAFKRANGYSELEISQKRTALENVLVAENLETHFQRLKKAGFSQVETVFQAINFVTVLAIK